MTSSRSTRDLRRNTGCPSDPPSTGEQDVPVDWSVTSARIRGRADGRCECQGRCGHHRVRCLTGSASDHRPRGLSSWPPLKHQPHRCDDTQLTAMCAACLGRWQTRNRRLTATTTQRGATTAHAGSDPLTAARFDLTPDPTPRHGAPA